jgi:hypothetical protein
MATRLNTQPLHPETVRLLGLDTWTADPAVSTLFGAIRDLIPINAALRQLNADRAGLCWQAAADVGTLAVETRERGQINVIDRFVVPSGACAELWRAVEGIRDGWIEARCKAEGLRPDMADYDRYAGFRDEVEGRADAVDAAWVRFVGGAL